jgi:hypothetical protein
VLAERPGLQRVALDDGSRAYVLTQLIGPVAVGDRVVVNTTAVDLGLGTGGWHVVHWNLARDQWAAPSDAGGREMKLRYTSEQVAVATAPARREQLDGVPVVVCDLHSQVACVALAFAACAAPARRLAYLMTDTAALALAVSDLVPTLPLAVTVTCGQAFGGDLEAVNVTSGLLAVAGDVDAYVVGPGPGAVGTRSRFGFGGLEGAATVDAVDRRGGRPIVCVRWSETDERPAHRGVSHHTLTVLDEARATAFVAVPRGEAIETRHEVVEVDVPDGVASGVETMGREDAAFVRWAAAAGVLAAELVIGR